MSLLSKFEKLPMDRPSIHGPVQCTYSVFNGKDGKRYIQLDTYGSTEREIPGKKSQSLQLNEDSVAALLQVFEREGFK